MSKPLNYEQERELFSNEAEKFKDTVIPVHLEFQYTSRPDTTFNGWNRGISKREYFAALAMQGICGGGFLNGANSENVTHIAWASVALADALIDVLNEK